MAATGQDLIAADTLGTRIWLVSPPRRALAALLVARRLAVEMTGHAERQLVSFAATCPKRLAARF